MVQWIIWYIFIAVLNFTMDCRRCWNVCCTCCVGFSLLHFTTWCGTNPPAHASAEACIIYQSNVFPQRRTCVVLCYTDWLSHRQQCTSTSRFQAGPPGLQGFARCNCGISCRRLPACLSCRLRSADIDTCCVPRTNTRLGDRTFAAAGPRL